MRLYHFSSCPRWHTGLLVGPGCQALPLPVVVWRIFGVSSVRLWSASWGWANPPGTIVFMLMLSKSGIANGDSLGVVLVPMCHAPPVGSASAMGAKPTGC